MKIIQVTAIDSTMITLLRELNRQILYKGHELICVCSKGRYTDELKKYGCKVVNINIDRKLKPISNIRSILKMYKVFKKEKPDIVHVHTPVAAVLGRIAAKLAKVHSIIYTAHGFYFHDNMSKLKYKIFLFIEKIMAKHFTDYIFTQSEEDRITALNNKFINKDRILTISNGVDVNNRFNPIQIDGVEIEELKEEFGIKKEDIVLTFIGRLVKEKGIIDFLEAIPLIKGSKKVLVVGDISQHSRDKNTKNELNKYKDNKNIIFTGYREDIKNILKITDIFCLPSYREGMPRSIIEAMAMECAVIATNIRGCREEVIENRTGFLVNLKSPIEIANRINLLIENKSLLKKIKINGRKKAVKYYDEKKVVIKQLKIYQKLATNKISKNSKKSYRFKSIFDFITSLLLIIAFIPLYIIVGLLVLILLGRPILFIQERPGKNRKIFKIYKFRTMVNKVDRFGNPLSDGNRLTKFGKFLRKLSLDELPQLINVLKGDMSLVGPRPLLKEYLDIYNEEQDRRHEVKPGITGWTQVNGRNDISWEEKFKLDTWYVDNYGLMLDIKILLKTIIKVFRSEGINKTGNTTTDNFIDKDYISFYNLLDEINENTNRDNISKNVVIIGARGHAKVIVDTILRLNLLSENIKILGFLDDDINIKEVYGIPVLGKIRNIKDVIKIKKNLSFIIAIDDNEKRKKIVKRYSKLKVDYMTLIHPDVIIGYDVEIGTGTFISPGVIINSGTIIGNHVIINANVIIETDCKIFDYVYISIGSIICKNVSLNKYSHIGIGCNILSNVNIGKYSVIKPGKTIFY